MMLKDIPPPPGPPPRRSNKPMPPYRYVPGCHPHPFRHPGGHSYTGGGPPLEDPSQNTTLWIHGCDLFDHRYYWEAHEAWEACWHHSPPGADRERLQGLIQAAAALLKRHMGHHRPARRLQDSALRRLRAATRDGGRLQGGLDLEQTTTVIAEAFAAGGWPLLVDQSASGRIC